MGIMDMMPSGRNYRKRYTGIKRKYGDWKKIRDQEIENKKKEQEEFEEKGPEILAELDSIENKNPQKEENKTKKT